MEGRKLILNCYGNEKQHQCAKAWANPQIEEILYGGAKGGAKSYTGCALIFGTALTYPDTDWFISRKVLKDLRTFTIPSITEVFEHYKITSDYYKFNGQDSIFTLYNKSRVQLIDAKFIPSDPMYQRFGSMQKTGGWIEEAGEFEKASKTALRVSIGRKNNDKYNLPGKLLMTANPAKNFLNEDFFIPFKNGTLPASKAFIQAFLQDNKKRQEGYLEMLQGELVGVERERLLLGNWEYDNSPDALILYDKIMDIFQNIHLVNLTAQKYLTCDVARLGSDKCVILVWRGFEVIAIIEFPKSKTTLIQETITALQVKYKIPHSNIIADEDGVGGGVVDNLRIKGFVNNSRPLTEKGKMRNYSNLKAQCYYKYADRVNANGVYISQECEISSKQRDDIKTEHEQVKSWKADSDGKLMIIPKEQVKQNIGHSPDYTDALMMREYFELRYNGAMPTWTEE